MAEPVSIALLYPELLGTYGDGGNAAVLAQRLRWRNIPVATGCTVSVKTRMPTAFLKRPVPPLIRKVIVQWPS